ncbi:MAG TPA: PIN domain-containing protein [Longimicrobiaceae bacterium]|nr:PIN domain-containing protein [Longimicrobiaceae bacterium]
MPGADRPIIVDANILFSALLRSATRFARILLYRNLPFCICESTLIELFRHKERIVRFSKLDDGEVITLLHALLRRLKVEREELITESFRAEAVELCRGVDPGDVPFVALTLALDGLLWTGDQKLRNGLTARGFTRFFDPE